MCEVLSSLLVAPQTGCSTGDLVWRALTLSHLSLAPFLNYISFPFCFRSWLHDVIKAILTLTRGAARNPHSVTAFKLLLCRAPRLLSDIRPLRPRHWETHYWKFPYRFHCRTLRDVWWLCRYVYAGRTSFLANLVNTMCFIGSAGKYRMRADREYPGLCGGCSCTSHQGSQRSHKWKRGYCHVMNDTFDAR